MTTLVLSVIEISVVLVWIVGTVLIIKEKELSVLSKVLWIIFLGFFNFIALAVFFLLRKGFKANKWSLTVRLSKNE
jgi:hypothetical protein